jgi:hypothetical protein
VSDDAARQVRALCDRGMTGCGAGDARAVEEVLLELIEALDFEYEEAALRLFGAYDDALEQVRAGRFEPARAVVGKLREACATPTGLEAAGDG